MCDVYSIDNVAAYEEVDGSRQQSNHLTPEQRCYQEMTSVILSAHREHEDRIRHQVMSYMKQREDEELAKRRFIKPFHPRVIRDPIDHDEEVRALMNLAALMENYKKNKNTETYPMY